MRTFDMAVIYSSFSNWYSENRSALEETLSIIVSVVTIVTIIASLVAAVIIIRTGSSEEREAQLKKLIPVAIAVLLILICLAILPNCCVPTDSGTPPVINPPSSTSEPEITTTSSTTTTTTTIATTTTTTASNDSPFSGIRVGGTVSFGEYCIGSSSHTSPLTWRVLDIDRSAGVALLITEQAIDCKSFDSSHSNIPWKNSDLRGWLNDSFYFDAFSDDDRNYIQHSSIYTMDYSKVKYYTDDYVFCLSEAEAYKYFNSDVSRQATPTPFAVSNGIYEGETTGNCCWWLRSVGYEQNADCVDFWGTIMVGGTNVNSSGKGVRPVIYVYI